MKKALFMAFALLLLSASAFAVVDESAIKVFAVADSGVALNADLALHIELGSGKVWSSTDPLVGTTTQTTERIAVQIAKNYFDRVDSYDYKFDINSEASLVEGPSAGAAMALLVVSMLHDKKVPPEVSITGTINTDGTVGRVGGVFEKSKEAARIGIELFMIPSGEAKQIVKFPDGVKSINLPEYAKQMWGLKVLEVSDIDEVLSYAFQDIEKIDVNVSGDNVPEFIPAPIKYAGELAVMHDLTVHYIERSQSVLGEAKKSLSGTLLDEPQLIDELLSSLNNGERTLEKAKLLFDHNYLYSAANYSFITLVNASLVKDIADNPSILSPDSTGLDLKLNELSEKISELGADLNASIPVDMIEWHIAAKERLSWAEFKLNELLSNDTIIVTINGQNTFANNIERLRDYEFANAWHIAAADFFEITKNSKKLVASDGPFSQELDDLIAEAENAVNALEAEEAEDAQLRLDSAKMQKRRGWLSSAMFDAASALAFAEAESFVKEKDLNTLSGELSLQISAVSARAESSGKPMVWARVYLDHAIYFFEETSFYRREGQTLKATDSAKSGIALVFLAGKLADASERVYGHFDSVSVSEYIAAQPNKGASGVPAVHVEYLLIFFVGLSLAFACAFFIVLKAFYKMHEINQHKLFKKLSDLRDLQKELSKSLASRKISGEDYAELHRRYQKQFDALLRESEGLSDDIVKIDRLRSKLFSGQYAVRGLSRDFRKGMITEEDFERNIGFYESQIKAIREELRKREAGLAQEKSQIRKQFKSLGKKVKKKNPKKKKSKQ